MGFYLLRSEVKTKGFFPISRQMEWGGLGGVGGVQAEQCGPAEWGGGCSAHCPAGMEGGGMGGGEEVLYLKVSLIMKSWS